MEGIAIILFILVFVVLWFLPFILIAGSSKTSGKEKIMWLLCLFFISWFAWIIYMFLAPVCDKATSEA